MDPRSAAAGSDVEVWREEKKLLFDSINRKHAEHLLLDYTSHATKSLPQTKMWVLAILRNEFKNIHADTAGGTQLLDPSKLKSPTGIYIRSCTLP